MGATEVAFLERLVSGSPLIVGACFIAIWVLWTRMASRELALETRAANREAALELRLSAREQKTDAMVREMLETTHKMTSAVEALTDAIKHPRN